MKNAYQPKSRQNELVVQELGNELLIYDLQTHKAVCLNETSALVWNLCAGGGRTVADISRRMSKELKMPIAEDFVRLALDNLRKENLLAANGDGEEATDLIRAKFNGLSRREAIRKVGLASMIALPVITGLVAPTAAQAQSRCAGSGTRPSGASLTCATFPNAFDCAGFGRVFCCSGTATEQSGSPSSFSSCAGQTQPVVYACVCS